MNGVIESWQKGQYRKRSKDFSHYDSITVNSGTIAKFW